MTKKVEVEWKQEVITEIVRVKQIVMERPIQYQDNIASTHEAGRFGVTEIGDEAQEVVLVVILDTKNKINAIHRVFTGSLNTSVAHPREIFRSALLNNGARILVYHNHPSGNTFRSRPCFHSTDDGSGGSARNRITRPLYRIRYKVVIVQRNRFTLNKKKKDSKGGCPSLMQALSNYRLIEDV